MACVIFVYLQHSMTSLLYAYKAVSVIRAATDKSQGRHSFDRPSTRKADGK
jgi:hypothetical protein